MNTLPISRIAAIQKCVAEYYRLPLWQMTSMRKKREVARPRMLAMFLCKELTAYGYSVIARAFNRDHTTVLHAVRTMQALFLQHPELRAPRDEIVAAIMKCPEGELPNKDALFFPVLLLKKEVVNGGS
jgi:chromosomal replication initiation ATPase DnaA